MTDGGTRVLKVFLSLTFFVYVICAMRVQAFVYVYNFVLCLHCIYPEPVEGVECEP